MSSGVGTMKKSEFVRGHDRLKVMDGDSVVYAIPGSKEELSMKIQSANYRDVVPSQRELADIIYDMNSRNEEIDELVEKGVCSEVYDKGHEILLHDRPRNSSLVQPFSGGPYVQDSDMLTDEDYQDISYEELSPRSIRLMKSTSKTLGLKTDDNDTIIDDDDVYSIDSQPKVIVNTPTPTNVSGKHRK